MGHLVDRTHRDLSEDDIQRIADTYHAWRGEADAGEYEDVAGFCKAAGLDEIRGHDYVLTPGRYVGAADMEEDDEPFEEKMERLRAELVGCSLRGDLETRGCNSQNLRGLGYEVTSECISGDYSIDHRIGSIDRQEIR